METTSSKLGGDKGVDVFVTHRTAVGVMKTAFGTGLVARWHLGGEALNDKVGSQTLQEVTHQSDILIY